MMQTFPRLCCLLFLFTNVQSQHVEPLKGSARELRYGEDVYFLDTTGLGDDYYKEPTLDIQLMEGSPIWKIFNSHEVEDHFAGESDNGLVACHFHTHTTKSDRSILNGMCHDRGAHMWYEIKEDTTGSTMMTMQHEQDLPPEGEPLEDELNSFVNALGNLWTWARELPWVVQLDPERPVDIDVMIIWSTSAECARSFRSPDCSLDQRTLENMEASVDFTFRVSNFALSVSETNVTMVLAHAQRDTSGYKETSTTRILRDISVPLIDNALNYIQPLRDEHKADLVSFVFDYRITDDFAAGRGFAPLNLPIIHNLPLPPFLGFSTFCAQCLVFGYTPAHEWGHILGCFHDRGTADDCGSSKTNYGYRSPSGTFRTIMSYACIPGQCDDFNAGQFVIGSPTFRDRPVIKMENHWAGKKQLPRAY